MLQQIRRFFVSHPLLFLVVLSPQVEYLTGSSQLSWLVGNPPFFFAFVLQNLGSYGLAVVLIREAVIRWQKGWASIIALGAAYGILNEGIGAATLFNPDGAGIIGTYGRWLGVNWVWTFGLVLLVHPLFSVSLPILEHRLALPQIRGHSLMGSRGLILCTAGLVIDGIATLLFVGTIRHFWAGPVLWAACCVAMMAFAVVARVVPKGLLRLSTIMPRGRSLSFFLLGALFIWAVTLGGDFLANLGIFPLLVAMFFVVVGGLPVRWVFRNMGQIGNERRRLGLAAGLVASLMPMGFFSQLGAGIGIIPVVVVDLLTVLFFARLWARKVSVSRVSSC